MSKIELDLLGNALDSLDEALNKYELAQNGEEKAYKFCVLNLSHFFELVFKHYVACISPVLIYKEPSKKITDSSFTITLDNAIVILENHDYVFDSKFKADLVWFKKLRNKIEHHKFDMGVQEVNDTIGRLIKAFELFQENRGRLDLEDTDLSKFKLFFDLAYNYDEKLKAAQTKVDDSYVNAQCGERHKYWDNSRYPILHCSQCDHDLMVENEGSASGYKCTFCHNEEADLDYLPDSCQKCGVESIRGELLAGNCYYCSGRYHADKAD